MITIEKFFDLIDYRIGQGSEYLWGCYGDCAWILDSSDEKFSIVYDAKTQEVFEVKVSDFNARRAYRIINPSYREEYFKEAARRGVSATLAWDDVSYIDLETDQDWLIKARAILTGQKYDTRVEVPVDLDEAELLALFKMAHERDITFNKLVEEILIKWCSEVY